MTQQKIIMFEGRYFLQTKDNRPAHFQNFQGPFVKEYFEIEENKLYKVIRKNFEILGFYLVGVEITQSIEYILSED